MDSGLWLNIALVVLFILIGGVFAGTEIALISLRESQIDQLERQSSRGARVAAVARDPNRFLASVQIGVTVAGFLSAAFGASTIAPYLTPVFLAWGMPEAVAAAVSLIVLTLIIAYLSLVLGELVPKRFALQRASSLALAVGPTLDRFSRIMRPVIWLLSVSTNGVVRLLGGDPKAAGEEMSDEELRELVVSHEGLPEDERQILRDVFEAGERSIGEVMRPRHDVVFLDGDLTVDEATRIVATQPYSRYPVIGTDFDDILGFVHVRDLYQADALLAGDDDAGAVRVGTTTPVEGVRRVRDLVRRIAVLPATNALLPSMSMLRRERIHIAVVIDEYGGTDGIVTLEDLVEELVGEIEDEHDMTDAVAAASTGDLVVDAGLNLEDFREQTGIALVDEGDYETVGGYILDRLGRVAAVGDVVEAGEHELEVVEVEGHRIERVRVRAHVDDGGAARA
ncbi:hemolysin family protein [Microbacterium fluvii]|uniref:Hemolysin family protein n=1 Tax=Microbacterium fluvii TaxID=415215 RepID=A0ABW2H9W4_9MICO|nr:hemolysin family protein [Microbacterium fluvii]MCU4671729.1 hemolysin family protein [Microbacterium fluvii]